MGKWASNFDQMLEMGSMNFGELRLMSKGVDRSVALQLGIPPNVDDVEEFLENRRGKIPKFFARHPESQGSSRLSASRVLTQAHFHRQLRTIVQLIIFWKRSPQRASSRSHGQKQPPLTNILPKKSALLVNN